MEWSGTDLAGGRGATAVGLHGPPLLLLRGSASVIAPQARFKFAETAPDPGGSGEQAGDAEQQAAPQGRGGEGGRERAESRGTGRRRGRRTQTDFFKEASSNEAAAESPGRPRPTGTGAEPAAAAAAGPKASGGTARQRRAAVAKKNGAMATATGRGSGPGYARAGPRAMAAAPSPAGGAGLTQAPSGDSTTSAIPSWHRMTGASRTTA